MKASFFAPFLAINSGFAALNRCFRHSDLRWRFIDRRPKDPEQLDRLHELRKIDEIIEGGQTGADTLAGEWADDRGVLRTTVAVTKEHWRAYGNAAGPLRNGRMLSMNPHGVLAFPGGRGTADCVGQARRAHIKVWQPLGFAVP